MLICFIKIGGHGRWITVFLFERTWEDNSVSTMILVCVSHEYSTFYIQPGFLLHWLLAGVELNNSSISRNASQLRFIFFYIGFFPAQIDLYALTFLLPNFIAFSNRYHLAIWSYKLTQMWLIYSSKIIEKIVRKHKQQPKYFVTIVVWYANGVTH